MVQRAMIILALQVFYAMWSLLPAASKAYAIAPEHLGKIEHRVASFTATEVAEQRYKAVLALAPSVRVACKAQSKIFVLENPVRIVLDVVCDSLNAGAGAVTTLDSEMVKKARLGQHKGKVRLVIDIGSSRLPAVTAEWEEAKRQAVIKIDFGTHAAPYTTSMATPRPLNGAGLVRLGTERLRRAEKPVLPKVTMVGVTRPALVAAQPLRDAQAESAVLTSPSHDLRKVPPPPAVTVRTAMPGSVAPEKAIRDETPSLSPHVAAYTLKGNEVETVALKRKTSFSRVYPDEAPPPPLTAHTDDGLSGAASQKLSEGEAEPLPSPQSPSISTAKAAALNAPAPDTLALDPPTLTGAEWVYPDEHDYSIWWISAFLIGVLMVVMSMWSRRQQLIRQSAVGELPEGWNPLVEHYSVLRCDENAPDEEVRQKYRELVKVFHADSSAAQDLPEEIRSLTQEEFLRIQRAYIAIKRARNLP